MANLLDDPEIQKYLFGSDPMDNTGRNQTTRLEDLQNQQVANGNTPPVVAPPLVSPQDVVQPPTGATEFQPSPGQPTQYAFQQPRIPKITSILDLIRENKPVQDPTLDARYKKAAMLDSLGQAFGNLAGAVGVGLGASVPKLPVNSNIAKLYGAREAEKQRLLQQKRGWDAQMLQGAIAEMTNDTQNKRYASEEAWKQKDYDYKVGKLKQEHDIAFAKATTEAEQQKIENDFKRQEIDLRKKFLGVAQYKASQSAEKEDPKTRNQRLYLPYVDPDTGVSEVIPEGKARQYYGEAKDYAMQPVKKNADGTTDLADQAEKSAWAGRIKAINEAMTGTGQENLIKSMAADWITKTRRLERKQSAEKAAQQAIHDKIKSADMDKMPVTGLNFAPTGTITGPAVGSHAQSGEKKPFDKNKFLAK